MIKDNPIILAFYKFKTKHPRIVMTALVFFIIPIVITAGLSYEMKSDVATYIPTIIVDHDHSEFSNMLAGFVEDTETFKVVEWVSSDSELEEKIKKGEAYAGIIIPENFYADMLKGKAPKILTVYDGSALTVLTTSKAAMTEILLTMKGAYMKSIFHGKLNATPEEVMNYVTPIDVDYKVMFNSTKSFRCYLLIGMLIAVLQVGISMQGAERGYESQIEKKNLAGHLRAIGFNSLMSCISIILIGIMEFKLFNLPMISSKTGGLVLTILYVISISAFGYIIGAVIPDRVFAIQISAVLVLPTTLLCGYTYPIYGMPEAYVAVAKGIPFYHYGNVFRNMLLKPMEFRHLLPDIRFFMVYILVEFCVLLLVMIIQNRKAGRECA